MNNVYLTYIEWPETACTRRIENPHAALIKDLELLQGCVINVSNTDEQMAAFNRVYGELIMEPDAYELWTDGSTLNAPISFGQGDRLYTMQFAL